MDKPLLFLVGVFLVAGNMGQNYSRLYIETHTFRRFTALINKVMSFLRIGTPKVNLILNSNQTQRGEKISGSIHLQGGWMKQKATRLECDLLKECPGKKPQFIAPAKTVLMSHIVGSKEKREIPFHFRVPAELPPSCKEVSYCLRTRVVFADSSKSIDQDKIVVLN